MNTTSEQKIEVNTQIRDFIADVTPIFRGRNVFIADVGAHVGSTFAAFMQSPLKINRACLFEANPRNFEKLKACVAALGAEDRTTALNLAVSDKPGKLVLHDMNDMSRVVGSDAETAEVSDQQVFEVEAKPLDDFQTLFPDGHISILKIDVEGHETEVIKGAAGLLATHAAEIVYVEAGLDRDNAQQTHYRDIEDQLFEHGYRLFKIYEQTMEWVDDRPLLRRMNMAFISPVVAEKYPYSMLRELSRLDSEVARLKAQLTARDEQTQALRNEHDQMKSKLATAHAELAALAKAIAEMSEKETDSSNQKDDRHALASKLSAAENRVRDLENSTIWRMTAPVRKILDAVKR